jgi:UDP-GlcNAc:undecaprenyl-phosphate/decaprenyl-phosphate GlcNAc-1-phosphate transferase
MSNLALGFLGATLFALVVTPLVRAFAVRYQMLDVALTARKIHGRPVPRLGGVAIVGAFYVTLVGLVLRNGGLAAGFFGDRYGAIGFLLGGLGIALLGVYDDLWGCRASQKFLVQFTIASLMYLVGFRIEGLSIPFGPLVSLGLLSLPFTVLWIVGVTNAFNLIDGLDGLAGGVALIAVATNLVIALGRGEQVMAMLSAILAGAVLGFLVYNFNPASIFMGDTGSMFLGFALGTISIESNQKSSAAVAILIPVTILGLPLLDTLLAVARRAVGGRPIFQADREHIHHRLLEMHLSHRQAVLALYVVSTLLGTLAVALTYANSIQTLAILGGMGAVGYLMLSRLGYFSVPQRVPGFGAQPQPFGPGQDAAPKVVAGGTARHLWASVKAVADRVGADYAWLDVVLHLPGGETVTRSYASGERTESRGFYHVQLRVPSDGQEAATIEFGWRRPDFHLEAAHQEQIEALRDEVSRYLGTSGERPAAKVVYLGRR